ncbi:immunity 50 family protein [Hymenobacter latericus]|uniref:immunity 50 family protein n=1 Tax=Hymenobacter sp. YIM 151858-1 TaxID=2987688 RepID=UPI002227C891|nr:immunity 50 family protein [Hymenobacter sp. YIM 151858-1]UYZ58317.1 immunity 50 family protein [Hymenobacter sp. YIM 151858-1]
MAEIEDLDPAIRRIVNSELVLQHFGYWPSFHDAGIGKVTFEVHPSSGAAVTFVIEACETTDEVTEQGHYKQIKHCDIELQFLGIQETVLGFDHQPIIFGLDFEERGNLIECGFASSADTRIIVAEKVSVLSLTPTAPPTDEPEEVEQVNPDEPMDAKNIFISSQHRLADFDWSDLIYVGLDYEQANEYKTEKVAEYAYTLFDEDDVYVVLGRHDSYRSTLKDALSRISTFLKTTNVDLCNLSFTKAMRFNKIGVMSYGHKRNLASATKR